ncbi:MAG: DciA family protein [Micropepsaceae bacterium]
MLKTGEAIGQDMSEREDKDKSEAPRIATRGPRKLAGLAGPTARGLAAAKGFAIMSIATRWADIAGPQLAPHARPQAISPAGILTVKVEGAAALLIQHQQRELIQRIAALAGEGVVKSLKIVQGPIARARELRPKPLPPRLSAAEEAAVSHSVAKVEDPGLRDSLAKLMRRAVDSSRRR